MSIPNLVKSYLDAQGIPYQVLPHPRTETLEQAAESLDIPLSSLARALVLKDNRGLLMAVLPTSHIVDFAALSDELGRDPDLAGADEVARVFQGCEPGSIVPLGEAFGVEAIVDDSLSDPDDVYFEPGTHTSLVRVSSEMFQFLQRNARQASFARPMAALIQPTFADSGIFAIEQTAKRFTLQRRIEDIHDLPPMPPMVVKILQIRNDPTADANELAKVIELDPSLAVQVVRYATSPFYGYRGRVNSIRDAIARVLGFDLVMNLALGIAIGKSFKAPYNGPLGLRAFWRHALYTAVLSQRLANMMPVESRPPVGLAYLAGLLHDLGHLIIGEVFLPEFFLLNRLIMANPDIPFTDLERTVIGFQHEQIGAWLMRAWGMPEELTVAVRWHHHEHYHGEHSVYPNLVLLADHLWKRDGMGDAATDDLPQSMMQALELAPKQVVTALKEVVEHSEALDMLASQFVP